MEDRPEPIRRAIKAAGGLSALARSLGLAPSTISEWSRVPAERVLAVELASGVSKSDLRPDLYPAETADRARAAIRRLREGTDG